MYGHKSKPSKIYQYGCLAPATNLNAVLDQMMLVHRYRNAIVAQELDRRNKYHDLTESISPGIADLSDSIAANEEVRKSIKDELSGERIRNRSRKTDGQLRFELAELNALLKEQRAKRKEMKKALNAVPKAKKQLKQLNADNKKHRLRLRAESELYWGSYLVVEQSFKDIEKGTPPKFHRWTGEGRIAVQLQDGLASDSVGGNDRRFRIVLTGKTGRGRKPLAECWLRIGSDEKGRPIWTVVPMVLHRPLPEGSFVKWVYLHRHNRGTGWRWTLSVVVSKDRFSSECADSGKVGISIGWKRTTYGLVVANWVGSDGDSGELIISNDDINRWTDNALRRAVRDREFNTVRDYLAGWKTEATVPDWFAEETKTLSQWRSKENLSWLVAKWKDNRFDGDDEAFNHAETWRRDDRRAHDSESGQRERSVRWRNDLYRKFVYNLKKRYHTAIIKQVNYADVAEQKETDERFVPKTKTCHVCSGIGAADGNACDNCDGSGKVTITTDRTIASPGRLAQLIKEGFARTEIVSREQQSDEPKPARRSRVVKSNSGTACEKPCYDAGKDGHRNDSAARGTKRKLVGCV